MKKQNGSFRSKVGIPQALTVSFVPGTHFLIKLRNPRTTLRSSGFSSFTYELFLATFPLMAFMGMPPALENETEDTSSLFLSHPLEMPTPGGTALQLVRPWRRRPGSFGS